MKILCLLVVLANIFIFLWEYRTGTFKHPNPTEEQQSVSNQENIVLLREIKQPPKPVPVQAPQPVINKLPESTNQSPNHVLNEPPNLNSLDNPKTDSTDISKNQLP